MQTIEGGNNSGKMTVLQTQSAQECQMWIRVIEEAMAAEERRIKELEDATRTPWKRFCRRTKIYYNSNLTQFGVGIIIMASYVTAMYQAQMLPEPGGEISNALKVLEVLFTVLFALELVINIIAHWFKEFFNDAWNVFDFVVVGVSLLALGNENLPAVTVLRLIRVFKILRLFRKLTSLRILINALSSSMVPVLTSMVILLLMTTMYAIVATDLFRSKSRFFENFGQSVYTLFQVATMDAWSSIVTRELLEEFEGYWKGWVMLFFVSYVLFVGLVLMNIVGIRSEVVCFAMSILFLSCFVHLLDAHVGSCGAA